MATLTIKGAKQAITDVDRIALLLSIG